MEKKTKQEIQNALISSGMNNKLISNIFCAVLFVAIGLILVFKTTNIVGYIIATVCFLITMIAIYNSVSNYLTIQKIKKGKFRHIQDRISSFVKCSGIIPGRSEYFQAQANNFDFFIHSYNNENYDVGDMIDAVFIDNNNVPLSIKKIDESALVNNVNGGFMIVPVIVPLIILIITTIIALIYPFLK